MIPIGSRIQTLRRNKNLTQAQLAEALSVTPQSVSKWENHLSAPDISLLPIIARFFGVTMDDLFSYRLDALTWKERFIRFMADNGALQFGSFRLHSGRISPYYISAGSFTSASQLEKLGIFYAECLRQNNVETTLLLGTAPQEAPIAVSTALTLYSRWGVDVRCGADPIPGDRMTLIKDTLTSGQTLKKDLAAFPATDVIVSVDRMERAGDSPLCARKTLESRFGVRIHPIVTLEDLIRAVENGVVGSEEHLSSLRRYQEDYAGT